MVAELAILKDFDHPNIVSLKKCIRTKDKLHIIMEFVEGGSLLTVMKKFGHQPEETCRAVMQQLLKGLAFLHSRRVIHRDIKCANILLQRGGEVKLSDFGIATRAPKEVSGAASYIRLSALNYLTFLLRLLLLPFSLILVVWD